MPTGAWPELAGRQSGWDHGRKAAPASTVLAALSELEERGWLVLHDLQRPGRRFASIDHIAVGPGGIVVIDTKSWNGTIEVVGGRLRQNGVARERECELAEASAAAVTAWLDPEHRTGVMSVICLVNQATPAGQPAATAVYGVQDLVMSLSALPTRLRTGEIWAIADRLRRTLADGSVPLQLTTASLATALAEDAHRSVDRRRGLRERVRVGPRLRRAFEGLRSSAAQR